MIPTLLVVSLIVFIIIQLPPGDFMTSLQAEVAATGGGQDARTLDATFEASTFLMNSCLRSKSSGKNMT